MMRLLLLLAMLVCATAARAQDVRISGLADFRLVAPSGQDSFLNGGLGKFRWGSQDHGVHADIGGLYLRGIATLTPELIAVGEIMGGRQQSHPVDLLDAYLRWRPVSTTPLRASFRAGAFFVPVSLENGGIGWTSTWTLTPSAINAWIGDELRTIGGEATVEWRGDFGKLEAVGSIFGWNQTAGVALFDRGWSFSDRTLGLFGRLRRPVAVARSTFGANPPTYWADEFRQFNKAAGYYAGLTYESPEDGRISLLHYDNQADPTSHDSNNFGWRTRFWSLGLSTEWNGVTILAQAITGSTAFTPSAVWSSTTKFWAAYVLAGYEVGDMRYALRLDRFGSNERHPFGGLMMGELGTALTAAATWSAREWLKITAEVVGIDYHREQRRADGLKPHAQEVQAQLGVRVSF